MRGSLQMIGAPLSTRATGLGDRFRYWRGASGRRYLFSAVSNAALDDLTNVVVILVAADGTASLSETAAAKVVFIGEIDGDGVRSGRTVGGSRDVNTRAFAHFLADTAEERRAILADLGAGHA